MRPDRVKVFAFLRASWALVGLIGFVGWGPTLHAAEEAKNPPAPSAAAGMPPAQESLYARVNDVEISMREFHGNYAEYLRRKYYHGQVPETELKLAYQTVSDQLIEAILFQKEIERRNIEPDEAEVTAKLLEYENRYKGSPQWQATRETALPGMQAYFRKQSQSARLEKLVKDVSDPTDAEVKAYYEAHKDLFTEPEKLHLHAILLQVDPSSSVDVWQAAQEEARAIVKRLRGGASFEEAATLHSGDRSAANGGDMGYLHRGMLPEGVEALIDKIPLGEISDPVRLLEGVAIIRLDDRKPAALRDYPSVAERAKELLRRERQEKAWQEFRDQLRRNAKVEIYRAPNFAPQ